MNLKELYQTNSEFKEYVDRYCNGYSEGKHLTLDEALQHRLIADYASWLLSRK